MISLQQLQQQRQQLQQRHQPDQPLSEDIVVVWFRRDLRVHDNPALWHACQQGKPVVGLFIDTETQWRRHDLGDGRIQRTRHAVAELQQQLQPLSIPLLCIEASDYHDTLTVLQSLSDVLTISRLCFNIEYEVNERRRDITVCRWASQNAIAVERFHDQCLIPPGAVLTQTGTPFRVYSPFKKAWLAQVQDYTADPLPKPDAQTPAASHEWLSQLSPLTPPSGDEQCSESYWHQRLNDFLQQHGELYKAQRDYPGKEATSGLSIALADGLLSPRQCMMAAYHANQGHFSGGQAGLDSWINELMWREFYRHITVAFPDVCKRRAFKPETERVAWRQPNLDSQVKTEFDAWCQGKTGYPIVDAAQRQLLTTGWMHNRLRMISAMFLTKHLLIDWRLGEAFFNQHLLDADFSSNNGGWQWSASTGADGAPYFRIFNPISQSQKFDPDGEFIARFVPELAALPAKSRHFPLPMERAQVGYPNAIVDHQQARTRALDAFGALSAPAEATP